MATAAQILGTPGFVQGLNDLGRAAMLYPLQVAQADAAKEQRDFERMDRDRVFGLEQRRLSLAERKLGREKDEPVKGATFSQLMSAANRSLGPSAVDPFIGMRGISAPAFNIAQLLTAGQMAAEGSPAASQVAEAITRSKATDPAAYEEAVQWLSTSPKPAVAEGGAEGAEGAEGVGAPPKLPELPAYLRRGRGGGGTWTPGEELPPESAAASPQALQSAQRGAEAYTREQALAQAAPVQTPQQVLLGSQTPTIESVLGLPPTDQAGQLTPEQMLAAVRDPNVPDHVRALILQALNRYQGAYEPVAVGRESVLAPR